MQTASYPTQMSMMSPQQLQPPVDPVRASVKHLLSSRALSLPCSTAAQAFMQLVQPTSRFQLALEALLPLLDSRASVEPAQRILATFLLYALYAPHPIEMNPFRSALRIAFTNEREIAAAADGSTNGGANEQLVWVLWKILKGDGNDLGPYSPSTLARSPLLPKLRSANLVLDEDIPEPIETIASSTRAPSPAPLDTLVTPAQDEENAQLAHAAQLLLAACDRVLTLAEQRTLAPYLTKLSNPPLLTSQDLAPLVANNPALAPPLVAAMLASPHDPVPILDALVHLPPSLPTLDLLGRLLRDGGTASALVRAEVLGRFVHESISWLDRASEDERAGLVADDRAAKGVQNLCRFYTSLIKLGIVDPASEADYAEMAHFSLRYARFEEANALYRIFATGKF